MPAEDTAAKLQRGGKRATPPGHLKTYRTAIFKLHNPSQKKRAMLRDCMRNASTTTYENQFRVLWKPSEPFFHKALRYSDNVSITLRNELENREPLVYGLTKDDISTELRYNEEHKLYSNRTMKPGERLDVFLKAPETPEVTS